MATEENKVDKGGSSITKTDEIISNSVEKENQNTMIKDSEYKTVTLDRKKSRSRAETAARSFIWGLEKERSSSSINQEVKFKKNEDSVQIDIDQAVPDIKTANPPLKHENMVLAATLVDDAKQGRHSDFIEDEKSLKLYHVFNHFILRYTLYISILLNLSLALFEKPSEQHMELPYWSTMSMEIGTLLVFIFRFVHMISFTERKRFWSDAKNIVVLVTIILTFLDMLIYVAMMNSSSAKWAVRWSRALRPLFVVNFAEARQIRRAFRNIRRTIPGVANVLILFFLNITIFTLIAYRLFGRRNLVYPNGSPYFKEFFDSFFELYVLVTTSNNPDVMMPAFDQSRWYVLYFIAFLLICLYIFMSVVLAVIYNNYKRNLKNEVQNSVSSKRQQLSRAFEILKVKVDGKFVVSRSTFNLLMQYVPPRRSKTLVSILWYVLDEDMDNYIDKRDFLKFADLLNVQVSEIKDRKILIEKLFPYFYESLPSLFLRLCVQHRYFRYTFDSLIVVNAFFIIVDIQLADWIFLGLFVLEILLKLYTLGFVNFFNRFWNTFDFIVIGSAAITTVIDEVNKYNQYQTQTLDALLVLRVLRLVKIIGAVERFRLIVTTIMHIAPFMLTYAGVMLVFYYSFAIVGMQLFQGLITYHGYSTHDKPENLFCGNTKLNGTDFFKNHYCNNNFNNILNAMVVLFELTVVNQWHVIAAGFVAVTNTYARLYFILFHITCVIIVLNIFTAFVLEAFILEYSFNKGKMESAMENKIDQLGLGIDKDQPELWTSYTKRKNSNDLINNEQTCNDETEVDSNSVETNSLPDLSGDTDIRFHLSKNVKDVEVLLQKMFEDELEEDVDKIL